MLLGSEGVVGRTDRNNIAESSACETFVCAVLCFAVLTVGVLHILILLTNTVYIEPAAYSWHEKQSTVGNALDAKLTSAGHHTYILDGDNVRHGLNSGLTFSAEDRKENVRRVGEVARLMVDLGIIVLVPVIRCCSFDFHSNVVKWDIVMCPFVVLHISGGCSSCTRR